LPAASTPLSARGGFGEVNGLGEVLKVRIDPKLVEQQDRGDGDPYEWANEVISGLAPVRALGGGGQRRTDAE